MKNKIVRNMLIFLSTLAMMTAVPFTATSVWAVPSGSGGGGTGTGGLPSGGGGSLQNGCGVQDAARMAGLLRYDKGLLLKYNPGGPHEGANGRQLCDMSLRKKRGRLKIRAAHFLFFNASVRVVVII